MKSKFYKGTDIYTLNHIKKDILFHVKNKRGFSLVRPGDGDLKIIRWIKIDKTGKSDYEKIEDIRQKLLLKSIKQGIKKEFYDCLMSIYKDSCNEANYITSFDHWYNQEIYWKKFIGNNTNKMLKKWKDWYQYAGIENTNYCSPDISFHLFIKKKSLLLSLKDKKICLISGIFNHINVLREKGYNVSLIKIPPIGKEGNTNPRNEWHSDKYIKILKEIYTNIDKHDIFFIGAGAIGRGYSMWIKRWGKVAIDIGRVMESWAYKEMPNRINKFMKINNDSLSFDFTKDGKKYEGKI